MPIKVATIRAEESLTFDLFLRVNEKFILYIKTGDDIEETRFVKLKDQGEDRLFILEEQMNFYSTFITQQITEISSDPAAPSEDVKAEVISSAAETAVEMMAENPGSKAAYDINQEVAKGLRGMADKNPAVIAKIFGKKGKKADFLVNHCRNVASLSIGFATFLGKEPDELDDLGAAALIHDIGLLKMDPAELEITFNRPPEKMTPDDKRLYNLHPNDSVADLEGKPYVNPTVLQLVKEHEERISGKGYPLKKKEVHELAQILGVANIFDKKVKAYGMSEFDAAKDILINEVGNFDLKLLQQFKEYLIEAGIVD